MPDYTVWGESIFRASWQGALLVLVVWGAFKVAKAASPTVKSWLWPLVMTKFLLAGLFVLELPVLAPEVADSQTFVGTGITGAEFVFADLPAKSAWPWEQALFTIWAFVVVVILVSALQQYLRVRKIVAQSSESSTRVQGVFHQVCEQDRIEVRSHKDVPIPLVFGFRHPVILVPIQFEDGMSDEELKMILTHEIAHVRRKDIVTAFYVFMCQTLFFFHPAVWFARREWQIARESACDQYAIEKTKTASHKYAGMLIKISAGAKTAPAFALSAVPAVKTLHRRIENMKSTPKKTKFARLGAVAAFAVIAAIAMPFAFVQKEQPKAKTLMTQDKKDTESKISKADKAQVAKVRKAQEVTAAKLRRADKAKVAKMRRAKEVTAAKLRRADKALVAKMRRAQEVTAAKLKGADKAQVAKVRRAQEAAVAKIKKASEAKAVELKRADKAQIAKARKAQEVAVAKIKRANEAKAVELRRADEIAFAKIKRASEAKTVELIRADEIAFAKISKEDVRKRAARSHTRSSDRMSVASSWKEYVEQIRKAGS